MREMWIRVSRTKLTFGPFGECFLKELAFLKLSLCFPNENGQRVRAKKRGARLERAAIVRESDLNHKSACGISFQLLLFFSLRFVTTARCCHPQCTHRSRDQSSLVDEKFHRHHLAPVSLILQTSRRDPDLGDVRLCSPLNTARIIRSAFGALCTANVNALADRL